MGTARRLWWRVAGPLLLAACVFVSASYRPASKAVSVHECCAARYDDPEPVVRLPASPPAAPQDETQSILHRFLAFGFVSFILGIVIGWIIRKRPDKKAIIAEVNKKINNRITEAQLHKSNLAPSLLGKAGDEIRTYLDTALD